MQLFVKFYRSVLLVAVFNLITVGVGDCNVFTFVTVHCTMTHYAERMEPFVTVVTVASFIFFVHSDHMNEMGSNCAFHRDNISRGRISAYLS